MRIVSRLALCALASLALALPAMAGVPTAHRISFQGVGRNASNQPVVSGDVRVRIYSAPTGGTLVYDSGTEFNGALVTGVFNVVLGSGTPLLLDNTVQYDLELDINSQEVVGDAAGGRQAFWPTAVSSCSTRTGSTSTPMTPARTTMQVAVGAQSGRV